MSLSFSFTELVGTPNDTVWSQAHAISPSFLVVITISGSPDGKLLGRDILLRIKEESCGLESLSLERLNNIIQQIKDEFGKGEVQPEIAAVLAVGDVAYLTISGGGQIWLKRDRVFQKILDLDAKDFESASGRIYKNDLFVLGTDEFFRICQGGVLKEAVENTDPQEAAEALAPLSLEKESAKIAAIFGLVITKTEEFAGEKIEESTLKKENETKRQKDAGDKKLLSKIKQFLGLVRLPALPQPTRSRKSVLTVAAILIFLLASSLYFGGKKRDYEVKVDEYEKISAEIYPLIDQAESLRELNPAGSRDLLTTAKEKLLLLEELKIEPQEIQRLKDKIESNLLLVVKEYNLSEVPLFYDLTMISAEAKGERLAIFGDYLAVLDRKNGRVLGLDTVKKNSEVLSGGSALSSPELLSAGKNSFFIKDGEGILELKPETKKTQKIIEFDSDWGETVDMKTFDGNLYLLGKGNNTIWRYVYEGGKYGSKKDWFNEQNKPDLSSSFNLSIDGSLWILANNQILKFVQGTRQDYHPKGLDKPIAQGGVLYTNEKLKNLYILDKGNSRLLVLAKNGDYQGQYLWSGLSDTSDFVVSEENRKIYLLSGSKIYEVELKN